MTVSLLSGRLACNPEHRDRSTSMALHEVLEREHPSRSIDPFQPDPEGVGLCPGHEHM